MGSVQRGNRPSRESLGQLLTPFTSIQKEMDRALHGFYDLFESKPFTSHKFENLHLAPAMDLIEDEKCYKLEIEMPGMDESDIKISINNNLLTIRGEKSTSRKDAKKNYIAREINYGSYLRCISLPQMADANKIKASFRKGMLWIVIPKKLQAKGGQTREIKVEKI